MNSWPILLHPLYELTITDGNEKKSLNESTYIMSIASDEVGLLPFPILLRPC